MRGRAPDYPGLSDPRAEMERLRGAYDDVLLMMRRFHPSSPAYPVLAAILAAYRAAALALANDPHLFGLGMGGQQTQAPRPAAPPIPGIVRPKLAATVRRRPGA
jgi:hypothetical protein